MASKSAGNTATSCVAGPLRAGGVRRDPGLLFFGSLQNEENDTGIIKIPMHHI